MDSLKNRQEPSFCFKKSMVSENKVKHIPNILEMHFWGGGGIKKILQLQV